MMSASSVARLADVLLFVGPSGGGKSTLIRRLQADFPALFGFSISHTTRAPRAGEADGIHYHFIDVDAFKSMIDKQAFVEHSTLEVVNNNNNNNNNNSSMCTRSTATSTTQSLQRERPNSYGTSKDALMSVLAGNKIVLMDTDVRGATNVRAYCSSTVTEATQRPLVCRVVLVAPPSMQALEERLRSRGSETPESLAHRMAVSTQWMRFFDDHPEFCDKRLVNEDLERCYDELRHYVHQHVVGGGAPVSHL